MTNSNTFIMVILQLIVFAVAIGLYSVLQDKYDQARPQEQKEFDVQEYLRKFNDRYDPVNEWTNPDLRVCIQTNREKRILVNKWVVDYFKKLQWTFLYEGTDAFNCQWIVLVDPNGIPDWYQPRKESLINRYHYEFYLQNKALLNEVIRKYENSHNLKSPIMPKGWIIDFTLKEYTQEEQEFVNSQENNDKLFVIKTKPAVSDSSNNNQYVATFEQAKQAIINIKKKPVAKQNLSGDFYLDISRNEPNRWLIQEFIKNPILLDQKKIDFTYWVTFLSFKPLVAVVHTEQFVQLIQFFESAYCKRSPIQYSLTNIKKNDVLFTKETGTQGVDMYITTKTFKERLINGKKQYTQAQMQEYEEKIYHKLAQFVDAIKENFGGYKDENNKAVMNQYLNVAVDIILNESLEPYIIEANVDPSIGKQHARITDQQNQQMISYQNILLRSLNSLQSQEKKVEFYKDFKFADDEKNMIIIYNEATGFVYGQ